MKRHHVVALRYIWQFVWLASAVSIAAAICWNLTHPVVAPSPITVTANVGTAEAADKMLNKMLDMLHKRDLDAGRVLETFKK